MEIANKKRTYIAIDLKSFYASVEAADRGLDPMGVHLVVADASRTEKTICLAVSPSLKAYGISGRARLFEVVEQVKKINIDRLKKLERMRKKDALEKIEFSGESFDEDTLRADPSLKLSYIIAPPRMNRYMEISSLIYSIYLKFVSEEDIFAYSIDEVFIDATGYLETYHMDARELAMTMIREILYTTGITATAGIGTNLYLAKLAMDIVAKHMPADKDGVRIAELDEMGYRTLLWDHKPLTDFWRTGPGTAARLERHGITTMGDLARESLYNEEWFYKTFGIDAEILIDHAWGLEPVTMAHIKSYRPESNSLCEGQVLSMPYTFEKARVIVQEMTDSLCYQLMERKMVTDSITLTIHYDTESLKNGSYQGEIVTDYYGRSVPKSARGTARLEVPSNLSSQLQKAILEAYERVTNPNLLVRRIMISANRIFEDTGIQQIDFFTDTTKLEKEKKLQEAMLQIKKKYDKNAILKGNNFLEGATMRERNQQVGGHKA